jgi:pilus assembly protein CpaB
MSRTQILFLLLAVGCALLAFMLFRGMMNQQPAAPVVIEAPQTDTVPVLVAAKELVMGERLTGLSTEWRDWPRGNIADYMITREARPDAIKEFEGSRARAPMLQGEPVADRKILAIKDGNLMSSLVRPGLRGYAIRISDRTAGSGFILPNDRVDIIATMRVVYERGVTAFGLADKEIVFGSTIITNVRVLAINQSLAADGDNASFTDLATAVLELDPVQTEVVARSEAQGELSLALRALGEAANGDDRPMLASQVEAPNSATVFKQGVRQVFSCDPVCDPVLPNTNAPFPAVVQDVGLGNTKRDQ